MIVTTGTSKGFGTGVLRSEIMRSTRFAPGVHRAEIQAVPEDRRPPSAEHGRGPRFESCGSHAIDIVQPPSIGISPMADMDADQTIVATALAAESSAETPRNAIWEARSGASNLLP